MSHPELPHYLIREIAANMNYKDLPSMCLSSRLYYETLCNNNYFWKLKTYYDFNPFYDIEHTTNWYETYQYYRSVFSKEFIEALAADPPDGNLIRNMIKLIKEKGFLIVDETDDNRNTALIVASAKGYRDIVQFLLSEEGADPNTQDNDGWTALMWASESGHTETAEVLLEKGADPNIQDNDGFTPLIFTSTNGRIEIVRVLLENDADPNLQSIDGWTAVMVAYANGHTETAWMLLEAGADPNLQHNEGWRAIDLA